MPVNTCMLLYLYKTKLGGEIPVFKSAEIIICPMKTKRQKIKFNGTINKFLNT